MTFPSKLHLMLETEDADIIRWIRKGTAFRVFDPKKFQEILLPKYYRHSKVESFQRQLNLYGFKRVNRGEDMGAYYHPLFLQGKQDCAKQISRLPAPRESETRHEYEQRRNNYKRHSMRAYFEAEEEGDQLNYARPEQVSFFMSSRERLPGFDTSAEASHASHGIDSSSSSSSSSSSFSSSSSSSSSSMSSRSSLEGYRIILPGSVKGSGVPEQPFARNVQLKTEYLDEGESAKNPSHADHSSLREGPKSPLLSQSDFENLLAFSDCWDDPSASVELTCSSYDHRLL